MSASVRCGALDDLDELPAAHHDASAVPESVVKGGTLKATMITAGIPTVFVNAADIGYTGTELREQINTDPEANMVTKADYAVIGDLHQVVPAISAEIKRRRGA